MSAKAGRRRGAGARRPRGNKGRGGSGSGSSEAAGGEGVGLLGAVLDRTVVIGNHVPATAMGCHIYFVEAKEEAADWTLGAAQYDCREFGLQATEQPPDLSVDPESGVLTAINASPTEYRCFYVTIEHPVVGRRGQALAAGSWRDEHGTVRSCTTLVLILRPGMMLDVCRIRLPPRQLPQLRLSSDVSEVAIVQGFLAASDQLTPERHYPFPLATTAPVLCSQGHRGCFTHFNPCTRHAIDLECPVGTPVLAIGNGRVVDVQDTHKVSGIHVNNLYRWNSLMIALDDGCFVEYVHIQTGTVRVRVGETVSVGQVVCASGDVGFCPAPHLHIQMHLNGEKNAVTIPFGFLAATGEGYVPEAGHYYDQQGPCPSPSVPSSSQ